MPTVLPCIITVTYEEIGEPQSPSENYGEEGGFHAMRYLKCAWGDRHTLARELKGTIDVQDDQLIITLPHAHPAFEIAFVRNVGISGFGKPGADSATVLNFEHAIVAAQYKTGRWLDIPGDGEGEENVLVEETLDAGGEYLTRSNRKLYWDAEKASQVSEDEAPQIFVQLATWRYTIMQIPCFPTGFFDLIGKVNQAAVKSQTLGITFAAETLLMEPAQPSRLITNSGAQAWKLPIALTYRPKGWNKFYKAGEIEPQSLFNDQGKEMVGVLGHFGIGDFTIIPGVVAA